MTCLVETIAELLVEPLIEEGFRLAVHGIYDGVVGMWRIEHPEE